MFRQEMDAAARSREFGLGSAGHNVFSETVYFYLTNPANPARICLNYFS